MTDDLSKINGVGPATVEKLKGRGITTFAQIAELTDDQILQLNDELDLRDSIISGDWRAQAGKLASGSAKGDDKPAPKPKGQTVPVRIKRDVWDSEGERHRAGTVIELPVEAAMDAVETGAATRVK